MCRTFSWRWIQMYFTDLQHSKMYSKRNLSLGHILNICLKFQSQCFFKVYSYTQRKKSAQNCGTQLFCLYWPWNKYILIHLVKQTGMFHFPYSFSLFMKLSVAKLNQPWKTLGSKCLSVSELFPYRFRGSKEMVCHVVVHSSSLCASIFNILWSVCTELCRSTVSVRNLHFMLTGSEKGNFPNNNFLWSCKWICGKTGKNNCRFCSVNFVHPSHAICFNWESFKDRWVLSNSPVNTIYLKCFGRD